MQLFLMIITIPVVGLLLVILTIPRECRQTACLNCRRLDGTWSDTRFKREIQAFGDYLSSLAVVFLLAFPITLAAMYLIADRLMPVSQIAQAFSVFDLSENNWKSRLEPVQKSHLKWLVSTGRHDYQSGTEFQRALWYGWPIIAISFVSLCVFVLLIFLGFAKPAIRDFVTGIRERRRMYLRLDVRRMTEGAHDPLSAPASIAGH